VRETIAIGFSICIIQARLYYTDFSLCFNWLILPVRKGMQFCVQKSSFQALFDGFAIASMNSSPCGTPDQISEEKMGDPES
jgi:hypothetical protein